MTFVTSAHKSTLTDEISTACLAMKVTKINLHHGQQVSVPHDAEADVSLRLLFKHIYKI